MFFYNTFFSNLFFYFFKGVCSDRGVVMSDGDPSLEECSPQDFPASERRPFLERIPSLVGSPMNVIYGISDISRQTSAFLNEARNHERPQSTGQATTVEEKESIVMI